MIESGRAFKYEDFYYSIERPNWKPGSASRYTITKDLRTGETVFIKENDCPTYPFDTDNPRTKERLLKHSLEYENHRLNVINTINGINSAIHPTPKTTCGNLVSAIDFFRDTTSNRFMEVYPFIERIDQVKKVCDLALVDRIKVITILTYALSQLHKVGIVHSDLKPEIKMNDGSFRSGNIILVKVPFSNEYTAKIIDFDGSYFEDPAKNNHYAYEYCIKGTPGYMSPELTKFKMDLDDNDTYNPSLAEKLSTKSDIFTLGIITHEYLTGISPITPDKTTTAHAVLQNKEVRLDTSLQLIHQALIMWMLEKEPSNRPNALAVFELLSGKKTLKDIPSKYTGVSLPEPWPSDGIVFLPESLHLAGNQVEKSATPGKYHIGKGFARERDLSAEDLVNRGIAKFTTKSYPTKKPPERESIKIPETSSFKPWPSDNIELDFEIINKNNIKIRIGTNEGQYILGTGFQTEIVTGKTLVEKGYAKFKGKKK